MSNAQMTVVPLTPKRPKSGPKGGRPRKMDRAKLLLAIDMMKERGDKSADQVAQDLGITRTTLYIYLNGDGSIKEEGIRLLNAAHAA